MLKPILAAFLILILVSSLSAVQREGGQNREILVLLDSKGEISDEGQQVMYAVEEYLDYYLYRSGYNPEIQFPKLEGQSLEEYLKQLDLGGKRAVLYLRLDGQVSDKVRPVRNYRRSTQLTRVEGFLTFTIDYQIVLFDRGQVEKSLSGQVVREPKKDWFGTLRGVNSRLIDSLVTVTPEPYEYIIEDAISDALADLPEIPAATAKANSDLPAVLLIDPSIVSQLPEWKEQSETIFEIAARSLKRSFDYGIYLTDIRIMPLQVDSMESLHDIFYARREQIDKFGDTLLIGLVEFASPLQQFSIELYDAVGLSQVGKRRILLNLLHQRSEANPKWAPYLNSLNLIHEIGHAFGAIHVSDLNSVMNHSSSWQGTAKFDPFNRQILSLAFGGELKFDDPAIYLYHVSRLLEKNSYPLVDFPAFYFDFLGNERNRNEQKKLTGAVGNAAFVNAAMGYKHWLNRDYEKAAKLFRELSEFYPGQAALYYYLGLSDGRQSGYEAMQHAAELGYWRAKYLLQRLSD